jgi:hypothetical protein
MSSPAGANPKYANWNRRRRIEEASRKCVHEKWTQAAAAREFGVSRTSVVTEIKKIKTAAAERLDQARSEVSSGTGLDPLGLREERRVGTFEEFDDRYFSEWRCPDCEKHHDRPGFHAEIMSGLESDVHRLGINLPPFHAKSTLITVKNTVYHLAKNPNHRRLIISKSLPFARTFLHSITQLLTNPELYPEGTPSLIDDWGPFKSESASDVWNTQQVYVVGRSSPEKDPSVQVLGVEGQIYGRRADDIVFDDIADLENQRNPERVATMLNWIDQEALNRIGKRGKAIWVGTRVHPGDIYSYLKTRQGYQWLRFPMILDDTTEDVLWPDHMPYSYAIIIRDEMSLADFQLVYQNIDMPGMGASFTEEILEKCKNPARAIGQYDVGWRLVAGLDPGGGGKGAGYTSGMLKGVDLRTGKRFYVDVFNEKGMLAPRIKDKILEWAATYPLHEIRVESNGLQSQIFQYDMDLVRALALKGVRLTPHNTNKNKWDSEFGVEASAPLFSAGLEEIPWGNAQTRAAFQPLIEQLIQFPMGIRSDIVMADWFCELAIRDLLRRGHLPLFDERRHVPNRIKRRRKVVDFSTGQVRRPSIDDQQAGWHGPGLRGNRRVLVGRPSNHTDYQDETHSERRPFVNVEGSPDDRRFR